MRRGFAVAALICGILGLLAGVNEWFMNQYVLPLVNWEGPLQSLTDLCWLLETALVGTAVILLAVSLMQPPAGADYLEVPPAPPPLPASPPLLPELSPDYDKEPHLRPWPKRRF